MSPDEQDTQADHDPGSDIFKVGQDTFQGHTAQRDQDSDEDGAQRMRQGSQHSDSRGFTTVPAQLPRYSYHRQPVIWQDRMEDTDGQYADEEFNGVKDHRGAKVSENLV